ncbi:type II secretion system protein GspL [Arabiibacter massiliensis]|uniref:type II secretion system protein GspL n=1 Tax=Arabiibacter massiliensis TaxID=1870985 RepID=UPI0009BA6913|nr:pilus assembly protein PilM [Arabiibacter massiliensis]
MAKLYTGIDIGAERLKMAVCNEQSVVQVAVEEVPASLVRDGRVTSFEALTEVVRNAARKNKVGAKDCALVLHSNDVFTRRITVPAMTVEELSLNLPFEFRDYIADDKDKYNFDYAVLGMKRDAAGTPVEMDILAAAVPAETIEAYSSMLRRAGFRLKSAAPDIMAYANLIAAYEKRVPPAPAPMPVDAAAPAPAEAFPVPRDYCFVDVGYDNTKVYLFPGGKYEVTRIVEFGVGLLAAAVADYFSVDESMARTYLSSDYEGAQRIEPCLGLYERLGAEVARIVSFFNFNYPDSQLDTLHYCGSGAGIAPLIDSLRDHVSIGLADINAIMPASSVPPDSLRDCPAAVGIALR